MDEVCFWLIFLVLMWGWGFEEGLDVGCRRPTSHTHHPTKINSHYTISKDAFRLIKIQSVYFYFKD